MNVSELFGKVFIQIDRDDNRFDECIKACYKSDSYVSAYDFFIEYFGIKIVDVKIIEDDSTYLVIQVNEVLKLNLYMLYLLHVLFV